MKGHRHQGQLVDLNPLDATVESWTALEYKQDRVTLLRFGGPSSVFRIIHYMNLLLLCQMGTVLPGQSVPQRAAVRPPPKMCERCVALDVRG